MRENPGDVPPSVDFPEGLDPTPADERESESKFDTSASKSKRQIGDELDKFDVDSWYIDTATGSGQYDWPGYVVRWRKDGIDYALVSDSYTTKKANARAAYWWLHETRMRSQRPVTTAHDEMAAAALPSGQQALPTAEAVPPDGHAETTPYDVLGVSRDASPDEIQAAFRERVSEVHPDTPGGDEQEFKRVKQAKEALLDGDEA